MPHETVDEIDVTIIVPIYNGATRNLSRCLDSITGQKLKNIEILLLCDDNLHDSIEICNKYASNDQRISVIPLNGLNMGEACNQGINKSNGKYITFVEPNDWIEPEMCQSMLEQAVKYDTDVTIAYHYDVKPDDDKKELNNELIWDSTFLDIKLTDKFVIPNFYLRWPYCWGNIYKKEFIRLNKIQFSQTLNQDTVGYDLSFSFLVFCYMKTFCILRGSLYNHFLFKHKLWSDNAYNHAVALLNKHSYIFDVTKERNIDGDFIKLEIAKFIRDINKCYKELTTLKQRAEYLSNVSRLLKDYLNIYNDNQFINQEDNDLINRYVYSPGLTALLDKRNMYIKILSFFFNIKFKEYVASIKIFKFPVLFIKSTPEYATFNVCMMPIRRKRVSKNFDGSFLEQRVFYFGMRIFKKTISPDVIKTYFLNFLVGEKVNLEAVINSISERIELIPKEHDMLYYACVSADIANTHHKTFPQFKNSNLGKSIAIFGAGPTLNFAPKINKSKIIACNRSYEYFINKKCDYFFGQDYHGIKSFYDKAIKNCTYAFIGRSVDMYAANAAPDQYRDLENVYSYYYHTWFYNTIKIKSSIENFPLADFYTVVHPALHFALYTKPDIIYLVGCDTSTSGYANKNILQFKIHITEITKGYQILKEFRDLEYPETRIISVNPVGLRNIFEDVYTKEFLDKGNIIDDDNLTIIDEI